MTPEELKKKLGQVAALVQGASREFLLLGGKDLEGRMKSRIFNKGQNSQGQAIGEYKSKYWIKKRKEGGRQVKKVDLENTGELRKSIQVVEDGKDVVLAIINDTDWDKAQGQELIQGKKKGGNKMTIFEPTAKEEKAVQAYINDLIEEKIDKFFQNI